MIPFENLEGVRRLEYIDRKYWYQKVWVLFGHYLVVFRREKKGHWSLTVSNMDIYEPRYKGGVNDQS